MPELAIFKESDLIHEVVLGNENAFGHLFKMYNQRLGTYIFRLTDSRELAEEVVQDIFLKIWMNRETLMGVKNFKAYLFVVSKNHALNCLRKVIKERTHQQIWEEEDTSLLAIAEEEKTANYYSLLDEAIDHLPPQQQKVYLLSRREGLKYAEIAEQLNLSRETVKKYLQIAITSIITHVRANMDMVVAIAIWILFS